MQLSYPQMSGLVFGQDSSVQHGSWPPPTYSVYVVLYTHVLCSRRVGIGISILVKLGTVNTSTTTQDVLLISIFLY